MDVTNSLFEHIRNRLPTGYEYGDDGKVEEDGITNHETFQQFLREDHEGDVGIFELSITHQPKYAGYTYLVAEVQIVTVVNKQGIETAKQYLTEAFNNIKDIKNSQSTKIWIKQAKLVSLIPIGMNSKGIQMAALTMNLKYLVDDEGDVQNGMG